MCAAALAEVHTATASEPRVACESMSPFWIWTQAVLLVFVLAGMIIAITKLA
jgi:hypothetical protein